LLTKSWEAMFFRFCRLDNH